MSTSGSGRNRTHLLGNEAAQLLAQTLVCRERAVDELLVALDSRRGLLFLLRLHWGSSGAYSVRCGGGGDGGALDSVCARRKAAGARMGESDVLKAADRRLEASQERGEVVDA